MNRVSWHCMGGADQNHPEEKEMQKGKMVVWGGLTNSWGRKRSKRQRRKGKIYRLRVEFHRITKRDKKALLNDRCKEIEENNRMTRNLYKKIRDTNGTFHAKVGTIKDRNCRDLTEAEDNKKRWQEYFRKNYTEMILMTQITTTVWSLT